MKKIAFAVFLHCFVCGLCAQSNIGFAAGLSVNKPSVTGTDNYYLDAPGSTGYGVIFGLFTRVPLHPHVLFRPSAEVSFRTVKATNFGRSYNHPANHFDLSLPLVYALAKQNEGLFLGAGPTLNFLLNPTHQIYPAKTTDAGVCGLIGYETPLGFSLNVRYTLGLLNLSDNTAAVQSYKSRHAAVVLGYQF